MQRIAYVNGRDCIYDGVTTTGSQTTGSRQLVLRQLAHDIWFTKKKFTIKLMRMLLLKLKWNDTNENIASKQRLDETDENVDARTRSGTKSMKVLAVKTRNEIKLMKMLLLKIRSGMKVMKQLIVK